MHIDKYKIKIDLFCKCIYYIYIYSLTLPNVTNMEH